MCSIEKPNCNPRSHNKMCVFILNGYNSWESADDATSVVRNRLTSARSSTGRVSSSLKVFIASTGTPIVMLWSPAAGRDRVSARHRQYATYASTRRMTIQYLYVRGRVITVLLENALERLRSCVYLIKFFHERFYP